MRKKIILLLISLSLLVVVSCGRKEEANPLVKLTGDITFQILLQETAVVDATVYLQSNDSKKTNLDGIVTFLDVPKGTYDITVTGDGFKEFIHTYYLNGEDQLIKINLDLEEVLPPVEVTMDIGDKQLVIWWQSPLEDYLAGYRIFKSLDGEKFDLLAEVEPSQTSYTDHEVENGMIYYYTIQSVNIFGDCSRRTEVKSAIPNPSLGFNLIYSKLDYDTGTLNICLLQDGKEQELTHSLARELSADYDLHMQQILYTSDESGTSQIYLMDLSGGQTRQLTYEPMGVRDPKFSQDGSQILYVSLQDQQIYLMSSYGTNRIPITQGRSPILLSSDKILFINTDSKGIDNFYLIDKDGQGLTQLTDYQTSVDQLSLSPDGQRIVYLRAGRVCTMNVDGTDEFFITRTSGGDYLDSPSWSPDGSEILYVSNDNVEQIPIIYVKGVVGDSSKGRKVVGYGIMPIAFK